MTPKLKLDEVAALIRIHLKRFERDPKINVVNPNTKLHPYYFTNAQRVGARIAVIYVTFQGDTKLTRDEATTYLEWLDDGNIGTHYTMQNLK